MTQTANQKLRLKERLYKDQGGLCATCKRLLKEPQVGLATNRGITQDWPVVRYAYFLRILICLKCSRALDAEVEHRIPIEERRRLSGRYPLADTTNILPGEAESLPRPKRFDYKNDRRVWRKMKTRMYRQQNGKCYWCRSEMLFIKRGPAHGVLPDNAATVDHLDSRMTEVRRKLGGHRKVLACKKCNQERGRIEHEMKKDNLTWGQVESR